MKMLSLIFVLVLVRCTTIAQVILLNDSATHTNRIGAEPPGYYAAATGLSCASLKTALSTIISTGVTPRTYTELWTQYLLSDVKPREVGPGSSPTVIWDVYSDSVTGPDPYNFTPGTVVSGGQQDNGTAVGGEGVLYNREHSVPLSWFNGSTSTPGPATDYFHIFPTDKKVNADRANFIYGVVSHPTITSANHSKLGPNDIAGLSGTAFEPVNAYKGDLARAFLYFVTRYETNMPAWESESPDGDKAFDGTFWPSVELPYLKMMLDWNNSDPVSQKEIDRNDAGYTYQGNRNPYIDHPEFVGQVWSSGCGLLLPTDITFFTAAYQLNAVLVNWYIDRADGLQNFDVERSTDGGRSFRKVGTVNWEQGRNAYHFIDDVASLSGTVFYRLKVIDNNLVYKYSNTVVVHLPAKQYFFTVYPNPPSEKVTVSFNSLNTMLWNVVVTDLSGRALMKTTWQPGQTTYTIPVQHLPSGNYFVRLANDQDIKVLKFTIANH